MYSHLL